ncbi:MAG: cytidine deaminase [Clostridiales bacterium]|jgi:dCMP deaminase|nr:cytidine deaminase [Clostridiales bacterium]
MPRRDKHNYYLDIADTVLQRGTCLRRNFGAIIVKNDEIISTGYAGAPRKRHNCIDLGYCLRQRLDVPRGQMYEICRSVHAEVNAVISAPRRDMIGATMYLVGREAKDGSIIKNATSCAMCRRVVINAGIDKVIIRDEGDKFRVVDVQLWVDNDDSLMAALPKAGY